MCFKEVSLVKGLKVMHQHHQNATQSFSFFIITFMSSSMCSHSYPGQTPSAQTTRTCPTASSPANRTVHSGSDAAATAEW